MTTPLFLLRSVELKIALVRNTDCFSIGLLHLGYLNEKSDVLSDLSKKYLDYLIEDVRKMEAPGQAASPPTSSQT